MTVRPAGLGAPGGGARAKNREAVVAAALRLFSERGYLGVRVEDIAREAGLSRATFYKYFSEREEILALLLDRLLGAGDDGEAEVAVPSDGTDIAEQVKRQARAVAGRMLEQERLARFVYSLPVRHEALLRGDQRSLPAPFRHIDQLLEASSAAGDLRGDVPITVIRQQVHVAVETALRDWATGESVDVYQRLDEHLELVFRGALAPARSGQR